MDTSTPSTHCRLGTRDSPLAIAQTRMVQEALAQHWPQLCFSEHSCKTIGDYQLNKRFEDIGTTGLFVKELEVGLLENQYDLAVHSLKDMPSQVANGLTLVPVFPRANPCDVLISRSGAPLVKLPKGAIVGTASARRQAQLQRLHPDIVCQPVRGNVQTRLKKLDDGLYDAIVLAAAGLERLGTLDQYATQIFDPVTECIPSPNQGILAVEYVTHRVDVAQWIQPLCDPATTAIAQAERAVICATGSGCHTPLGAYAVLDDERKILTVNGILFNTHNLSMWTHTSLSGPVTEAVSLGTQVGQALLSQIHGPIEPVDG